jgi:hypothetical protein
MRGLPPRILQLSGSHPGSEGRLLQKIAYAWWCAEGSSSFSAQITITTRGWVAKFIHEIKSFYCSQPVTDQTLGTLLICLLTRALRRDCALKSISITAIVILVIVSIAAFAQEPKELFGNADFPPNGYIYFSGLPTPPSFPASIR